MGLLFCAGLLLYYALVLHWRRGAELSRLLWALYLALGVSAALIDATGMLRPAFAPDLSAAAFLLLCVLVSISGFLAFRTADLRRFLDTVPDFRWLENVLLAAQVYAIAFFAPFAVMSFSGDANENRLELAAKMELMGSYGLLNTAAGAAAQLFTASLLLGFMRLALPEGRGRHPRRAALLIAASLSYVVYVFAYVGRDGVVYWLMSAAATFWIFRSHLGARMRGRIVATGLLLGSTLAVPFAAITIARFAEWETGTTSSLFEYFGSQINTFSDYAAIERPRTLGLMNFPMLAEVACAVVGMDCGAWDDLKLVVFEQYLVQGKEPWLFATYVSDFVGDFGLMGAFVLILLLAGCSHLACRGPRTAGGARAPITLSRLLLLMFLFMVPYWGVFYFRFSIGNSIIVLNLALVATTWAWARFGARRRHRATAPGRRPSPVPPTPSTTPSTATPR